MINIRQMLSGAGNGADRLPDLTLDPRRVYAIMINEVAPADPSDDFYTVSGQSEYQASALALFRKAGEGFAGVDEILARGIYLTNAVKIPKIGYEVEKSSIEQCASLLSSEIKLFPRLKVIMLMGDVARKAFNIISKHATGRNAVPAVPTYKLRGSLLLYGDIRVLPSYIMTGRSLMIEKQKLEMAAEDVRRMLDIIEH